MQFVGSLLTIVFKKFKIIYNEKGRGVKGRVEWGVYWAVFIQA